MRTVQKHLINEQNLRPTMDQEFKTQDELDIYFLGKFTEYMHDTDPSANIEKQAIDFFEKQEGEWYVLNNQETMYNVYQLSEINTCEKMQSFLKSLLKRNFEDLESEFKQFRF